MTAYFYIFLYTQEESRVNLSSARVEIFRTKPTRTVIKSKTSAGQFLQNFLIFLKQHYARGKIIQKSHLLVHTFYLQFIYPQFMKYGI